MEVEEGWSQKREGTSQSNWTLEPVCRWGQGMGGGGGWKGGDYESVVEKRKSG